jgi:hypothetical protein
MTWSLIGHAKPRSRNDRQRATQAIASRYGDVIGR